MVSLKRILYFGAHGELKTFAKNRDLNLFFTQKLILLKRFYFLLLLLQSQVLLNAQEFNVSETKDFTIKNDDLGSFVKVGNNYIRYEIDYGPMQFAYTAKLKKVRYGVNLYRYDENMKEAQKVSLDNDKKGMGPFVPGFFGFAGKLYVLYYQFGDDDVIKTFLAEVNPDNLTITKTVELFTFDQKNVGIFKIEDAIGSNKIFAIASPYKKKVLIAHCNSASISSCIIDEHLNITNNTFIQSQGKEKFAVASLFLDNNSTKYFAYNYAENKENRRGILTEDNKGAAKFQEFKTGESEHWANRLQFASSKDNNKVYVYANYYGNYLDEGLLLTTINAATFEINKPTLFAYPEDYKKRINKLGFGADNKGTLSVRRVDYQVKELDNGTLAFAGVPSYTVATNYSRGMMYTEYAGPIMMVFVSPDNKANFSMIPRRQKGNIQTSSIMLATYNDNLVCIYCDKEKNLSIGLKDDPSMSYDLQNVVLAAAVFDSDGNIIRRKKIADKPDGGNNFFNSANWQVTDRSFLIPIGRQRVNMVKYYIQLEKLATVEIM